MAQSVRNSEDTAGVQWLYLRVYPSFFYRTEEELERHNREKELGLLSLVITEYKFDDQHF